MSHERAHLPQTAPVNYATWSSTLLDSVLEAFYGLGELEVDVLEEGLESAVQVGCLSDDFLLDPVLVLAHVSSVVLVDVRVDDAHLRTLFEFLHQIDHLAGVSVRLDLGLLCRPGGALHELLPLLCSARQQVLGASQPSLQLLVLLDQEASLSLDFVVSE